MKVFTRSVILAISFILLLTACNPNPTDGDSIVPKVYKGLYSYGPELKSFTDCEEGKEYWVADSAKTLELAYSNFNFEKPYQPVYVEVICHLIKSDSSIVSSDFDSTMVVTKVIKISREIPDGPCN